MTLKPGELLVRDVVIGMVVLVVAVAIFAARGQHSPEIVPTAKAQVQHRVVILDDRFQENHPTAIARDTETGCEFLLYQGHLAYIPGTCNRSATVIEK